MGPTAVNEFQFSRAGNDIIIATNPETDALNQEIGSRFPTVFPQERTGAPSVFWDPGGYTSLWHQAPWLNHEDLFIWKDDFSKVTGSHSLKFGALYSHNIKNEENVGHNENYLIEGGGGHGQRDRRPAGQRLAACELHRARPHRKRAGPLARL